MKRHTPSFLQTTRWCIREFLVEGRQKPWWVRYGMAALWTGAAFGVRAGLQPWIGERLPFSFFLMSTMLAGWGGGAGPGLFALISGAVIGDYCFLPPQYQWGKHRVVEWSLLLAMVLPGLLAVGLFETLHRVRWRLRAEKAALAAQITRCRALERELEEARKAVTHYAEDLEQAVEERSAEAQEGTAFLEHFCYAIAHELRAPLRAITGFTSLLLRDCADRHGGGIEDYGIRIEKAVARMDRLIGGLLVYGRVTHQSTQAQAIDTDALVDECLHRLAEPLQRTHAEVHVRKPLQCLTCDRELLAEALMRLLENAVHFGRPGHAPHIEIWTETLTGRTRLYIRDQGVGISAEYHRKIFEAFHTLAADRHSHTGIGLAVVAKAAQRMGGSVGVESSEGRGATFWLELPTEPRLRQRSTRPEAAMRGVSPETRRFDSDLVL